MNGPQAAGGAVLPCCCGASLDQHRGTALSGPPQHLTLNTSCYAAGLPHHLTLNTLCYAMQHTYCKHTYTPTHTHLRRFTLFFSSNWLQPTSQGRPKANQSTTSLTPLHTESTQGQPYNMIACHNLTKPSIQHTITYSALLTTGVYC